MIKSYPMIGVAGMVIALLLTMNALRPSLLLYQTEYADIDSLRVYPFVIRSHPRPVGDTAAMMRYEAEVGGVGRVLVYIPQEEGSPVLQTGDTIIARTSIRRGRKSGRFDYGLYLRRQGIVGTAYVRRNYELRIKNYELSMPPGKRNEDVVPPVQERLYRRLSAGGLKGDELATTGALTIGYKEDLDPQLRRRFQVSGAAHVLAVSGLHTGILYAILTALLTLGGRVRPRHDNVWGRCAMGGAMTALMWGYAWLTGMTPSVVRCVVMITMVEVGKMIYRHSPVLNTIAGAAVLILLVRPLDLWSVSFQLSFAATAAIVVVAKDMEPFLHRLTWKKVSGRILAWLAGTVIISLAAQLGTLPITMYTFGQISNYFLLTNLIVLPLATLLVPCGLVTVALGGCIAGKICGSVCMALAWMMNHAVGWIEGLPGSAIAVYITLPMAALLYSATGMGWLTLHKSLWWLTGVTAAMSTFCILYAL